MASQGEGDPHTSGTTSTAPSSKSTPQTYSIARPRSTGRPTVPSIETPDAATPATTVTNLPGAQTPLTPVFRKPESPHPSGSDPHPAKAAKVAIPRLKRSTEAGTGTDDRVGGRHRVNHACEPCRYRKTKCSGERPVCRHCQDFKIQCHYADGKRDRVKKQFGSMTEKVADYEKLLRDLCLRVGSGDAELIRATLDKDGGFADVETSSTKQPVPTTEDDDSASVNSADESDASAGAGSTGALDRTEEDFTRADARDTGFMGRNSELTWMQRLRQENKYGSPPRESADPEVRRKDKSASKQNDPSSSSGQPPAHEDGFTIRDASYFMDDEPIAVYEAVDPYEMPSKEVANCLFEAYLSRVHPSFPIVSKSVVSMQYQKVVRGQIQRPPDKWLAILNMIFAIGAKYSHLVQAEWAGDDRDHLIYFTRAKLLGMQDMMFEHPDLQQIQISGLGAFYMLCISQINRAWALAGFAIRAASSMGLYMRTESSLQDSLKEIRYRVWWSLYTLEHRLCGMTGRINLISEDHVTTPLPIPYEEEEFGTPEASGLLKMEAQQGERNPSSSRSPGKLSSTPSTERSKSLSKPDFSRTPSTEHSEIAWAKDVPPNGSLYFLHLLHLTRLTQGIYNRLYAPASAQLNWKDMQRIMSELQQHLDDWYKNLPVAFDFQRKQRDRDFYDHRLSLGFFFYGTAITINRPALCRLDRKMPGQSKESSEFNSAAASRVLEAALDMLALLPDEPNSVGLNRVGPFWSILHWLMQACTVLMLELSFRAYHMPQEADSILEGAKKAVKWIHNMGEDNPSAAKAWVFCNGMIRDAAKRAGRDATGIPDYPPGRHSSMSQPRSESSHMSYQQTGQQAYSSAPMYNPQEYAIYDPLMHHDQFFPSDQSLQMPFQYPEPTAEEMELMEQTYHTRQDHPGPEHQQ